MTENRKIPLTVTGVDTVFRFDSFSESFGTVINAVPTYDGVYRVITGRQALKLTLTGSLTREQLAQYEALRAFTGLKKNITVNSAPYNGYALESLKADFSAGSLLGTVTVVFSEVT